MKRRWLGVPIHQLGNLDEPASRECYEKQHTESDSSLDGEVHIRPRTLERRSDDNYGHQAQGERATFEDQSLAQTLNSREYR